MRQLEYFFRQANASTRHKSNRSSCKFPHESNESLPVPQNNRDSKWGAVLKRAGRAQCSCCSWRILEEEALGEGPGSPQSEPPCYYQVQRRVEKAQPEKMKTNKKRIGLYANICLSSSIQVAWIARVIAHKMLSRSPLRPWLKSKKLVLRTALEAMRSKRKYFLFFQKARTLPNVPGMKNETGQRHPYKRD